ncbi:MAG: hypothetical protein AAFY88_31145, partial [Acidobacteriota bacterium]
MAPSLSHFGDIFNLRSPDLDGVAQGQSPVFGELRVQFGALHRGRLPFILELAPPGPAFLRRYRKVLGLLPPGTEPGLLGIRGELTYGRHRYEQSGLCLFSDSQKLSIGVFDADSGEIVEPFILRQYLYLSLFEELVLCEPRTPTDSFAYSCGGAFSWQDDRLGLEIRGETHIPYPEGYRFPLTRGSTQVGPGSYLAPFLRLVASEVGESKPPDLRGVFKVDRVRRGLDAGAELLECRIDTERQRLTLSFPRGSALRRSPGEKKASTSGAPYRFGIPGAQPPHPGPAALGRL